MSRRETGVFGELLALEYLVGKGYEVLECNYRTRHGEIDLILREDGMLVFVEVKARRGTGFGDPLEAITPDKQARVRRMAEAYLARKGTAFVDGFEGIRFDAVGILVAHEANEIRHVEDAF